MARKRKASRISAEEEITQPSPPPSMEDSQLAVAAGPVATTPSQPPPATLASRVADAAAAQLLIFDDLPADEKPKADDRVLLVGLIWGGSTLVELEQVSRGTDLPVSRLFDLPSVKLPRRFPLVKHVNGGHVL